MWAFLRVCRVTPRVLCADFLEQGDDLRFDLCVGDADQCDGDREFEAAGSGAAWIEVDDAVSGLDAGLVGVAADDHCYAGCFGVDLEPLDGVDEVDHLAAEFDDFGRGEPGAVAEGVNVAADCGDGGDLAQGGEDVGVADVAGVEDVVDTSEGGEGFGAEEAVGVGDDAYEHVGPEIARKIKR